MQRATVLCYMCISCLCSIWGYNEFLRSAMAVLHQLREVIKYGTFLEQMTNPTGPPWRRHRFSAIGIQELTA